MKKIFVNEMELIVENYNRDFIKSEVTSNRIIRIKCETKVRNDDNEKLKQILEDSSFMLKIPDEMLEFKAKKGEITYNYTDGNPFKDENVEYTHVLEIIEFEEPESMQSDEKTVPSSEMEILKKKVSFLERVLIEKGIISLDDIDKMFT
ncbi:hypothetical protein [Brassicibacter mesophilus]|uniref:hypothetical protein n=1 Tax=Brassicibacter mesophilus TaxID=745119 RepID=UPI003D1DA670